MYLICLKGRVFYTEIIFLVVCGKNILAVKLKIKRRKKKKTLLENREYNPLENWKGLDYLGYEMGDFEFIVRMNSEFIIIGMSQPMFLRNPCTGYFVQS